MAKRKKKGRDKGELTLEVTSFTFVGCDEYEVVMKITHADYPDVVGEFTIPLAIGMYNGVTVQTKRIIEKGTNWPKDIHSYIWGVVLSESKAYLELYLLEGGIAVAGGKDNFKKMFLTGGVSPASHVKG